MDPVLLGRIQFALTAGFHYIFPPLTIGLAWIIFIMLTNYLRGGKEEDAEMARFWIGLFLISFAIGVATGITLEFQFGTNWADYSRFVGDIFGAPLAAEGIFAFFLESTFLAVLIFGWGKVSKQAYWFASLMVALGSTMSAFWIIAANSWQQTPAGYTMLDGRAVLTDFWAALFNPSTIPRFLHTVDAALITGAFFVMGISAWYLLRGRHVAFAKKSLAISLIFGFVFSAAELPLGHGHAVQVTRTQPIKLAAFEGLFDTQTNAPLLLFGVPNYEKERTDYAIELPGLLSWGVGLSADVEVQGLKDFPRELWPPAYLTFFPFHGMVGLGFFFIGFTLLGVFLLWRGKLHQNRWWLWAAVFSIPLPFIGNELGWISAEVGRQPWIVYGLLKTKDAISSSVPAGQVLFTIVVFCLIYSLLFGLWILLLRKKIAEGPAGAAAGEGGQS